MCLVSTMVILICILQHLVSKIGSSNLKNLTHFQPMFHLCRNQVIGFTSKMFEKHLWKNDNLSKDAGQRPSSLLKMSLFHR